MLEGWNRAIPVVLCRWLTVSSVLHVYPLGTEKRGARWWFREERLSISIGCPPLIQSNFPQGISQCVPKIPNVRVSLT